MNKLITVSSMSSPPQSSAQSDSPISPNGNLMALYNAIPHQPKQEPHSPLSPISPLSMSKFNTPSLPGLHETLAGLSGTLPPFQLPSGDIPPLHTTSTAPSPPSIPDSTVSVPPSTPPSTSPPTTPSLSSSVPLKSESSSPPLQARHIWDVPTPSTLPPTSNTSFIITPNSYSYSTYTSDGPSRSPPPVEQGEGGVGGGRNGKQRKSNAPFSLRG